MFLFKEFFQEKNRAAYSYKKYRPYFGESVLDVGAGGSPAFFRPQLGNRYKAVDVSESRQKPDFFVNFEEAKLPFQSNEYETVLCFDNLEHCENCHDLFDELMRVSSRYVIVSLPNNWAGYLKLFLRGRSRPTIGYGFPEEKPSPGVRHKWFFNLEEAERFLVHRAEKNNGKVKAVNYVFHEAFSIVYFPFLYPTLFRLSRAHLERFHNLDEADSVKFGQKGATFQRVIRFLGLPLSHLLLSVVKIASWPFWLIDEAIKQVVWGWGSKFRYLNVFCRQIWVVIEKQK